MRLIVGLGNPGVEYGLTPHNLGFWVVDELARRVGARVERPEAKSLVGRARITGEEIWLAKPQTYMNASGMAVRELLERLGTGARELVVVSDDVALPWGSLRIRERGSAGGHNGLKSVIGALSTDEFVRVRLGIAPEHPVGDLAAYVLHPIRKADRESAVMMAEAAADAVEMIVEEGARKAMNVFNRRVEKLPE